MRAIEPAEGAEAACVETGSFAEATAQLEPARMTVVSYNIRYAVGSFLITGSLLRRARLALPRRRPGLVARHLKRAARVFRGERTMPHGADVIALQEADKGTARAGGHHVARELARELKMHYAHASLNLPREEEQKPKQWYLDFEERLSATDTGDTGLAILSRLPLLGVERLELPWSECAWRPRLALAAGVRLSRRQVNIFNLHIDPHASTDEQLLQHEAVLRRAESERGPIIIMGDFNTLTRASCVRVRAFLEERGYNTPLPTRVATWRAGLIRLHPDWIFVRGLRVTRWGVARPLGVSDHWPVWAEVELENPA
jgi:endonuclease/exonuclease/phosphatase family metal-dependent hydrolase